MDRHKDTGVEVILEPLIEDGANDIATAPKLAGWLEKNRPRACIK